MSKIKVEPALNNIPLTPQDGRILGRSLSTLVKNTPTLEKELAIKNFLLNENSSLSNICKSDPSLVPLITAFAVNKRTRLRHYFIATQQQQLGADDVDSASLFYNIGNSFFFEILTNAEPSIAIDQWIKNNPKYLKPIFAAHSAWLSPFLFQLASSLLTSEVSKFRIWPSAAISLGDHLSDLAMIFYYLSTSQDSAAKWMIGIVIFTLLMQANLTQLQTRGVNNREFIKELFFIVLGVNSVRSAYLLLQSEGQQELNIKGKKEPLFEPLRKYVLTKQLEMITEALPTLFLQLDALISVRGTEHADDFLPNFSVGLSIMTIAFTMTSIFYDEDISPKKRFLDTDSGVIRDDKRMLAFISAVIRCTSQVIVRMTIFYVLRSANKMSYFGALLGFEWACLMIPVLYNGWEYPELPKGNQILLVVVSFVMILTCHTHFFMFLAYHGCYPWFGGVTLVWELISSMVFAWAALFFWGSEAPESLALILGVVCAVNIFSHFSFIFCVEEEKRAWYFKYRKSPNEHFREQFKRSDVDDIKAAAASVNPKFTEGWRDDVKEWFVSGYPEWKAEKKDFLGKLLRFMDKEWVVAAEAGLRVEA